jgi:hypothetical protein
MEIKYIIEKLRYFLDWLLSLPTTIVLVLRTPSPNTNVKIIIRLNKIAYFPRFSGPNCLVIIILFRNATRVAITVLNVVITNSLVNFNLLWIYLFETILPALKINDLVRNVLSELIIL